MALNCFRGNDDNKDRKGKIPLGKRISQVLQDKFPRLHRLILRVKDEGAPSKLKRRRKRKASSLILITSPDRMRAQQKIDRKTAEDENRSVRQNADKTAIDNGQSSKAVKSTPKNVKDDSSDEDELTEPRGNTKLVTVSPPADGGGNRNISVPNTENPRPTSVHCPSPTTERVACLVNAVVPCALEDLGEGQSPGISPTDILDQEKPFDHMLSEPQTVSCPQNQGSGLSNSSWEIIIIDDDDGVDDDEDEVRVFIYGQGPSGRTDQGWEDRPFVDDDHQFIAILDEKDEGKNVVKKDNDAGCAETDDEEDRVQFGIGDKDNVSIGTGNNEQVITKMEHKNTSKGKNLVATTSVIQLNYASVSNDTKMDKFALNTTSDGLVLQIDHDKVPDKDQRPDTAKHDGVMISGDETSGDDSEIQHGGDRTAQRKGCRCRPTCYASGAVMDDVTVTTENVVPIFTDAIGASTGRWCQYQAEVSCKAACYEECWDSDGNELTYYDDPDECYEYTFYDDLILYRS